MESLGWYIHNQNFPGINSFFCGVSSFSIVNEISFVSEVAIISFGNEALWSLGETNCSPWLLSPHKVCLNFQSLKSYDQIYKIWYQW